MSEFENKFKDTADAVIGETKEVFEETKATIKGEKLESDVVGSAGYREAEPAKNGLAVASLVLGILSLIFTFITTWIGLVLGIVGIILGANARKQHQTSMATAGFVCSLIGTILSAIFLVCALACIGSLAGAASVLENM